ncbi:response regulator [Phaeocystidibacter luteus]|uniref:response regulator n=1 Tax=Phaeocystidibacter luteus TaxID=911197 RepID=UPI0014780B20|nr:response regulator [Phaeocystidibacter luteus]
MSDSLNIGLILIDDSFIDRTIVSKNMGLFYPNMPFLSFDSALDALKEAKESTLLPEVDYRVILLDIYMPEMNGFAFVDAFSQLPKDELDKYCVFMLSSSIDGGDMDKVAGRSVVKKFISKPLNGDVLKDVMIWAKLAYSDLKEH